jgi:hypothetical protein
MSQTFLRIHKKVISTFMINKLKHNQCHNNIYLWHLLFFSILIINVDITFLWIQSIQESLTHRKYIIVFLSMEYVKYHMCSLYSNF